MGCDFGTPAGDNACIFHAGNILELARRRVRPQPDLEIDSMYELIYLSAVTPLGLPMQVVAQGVNWQEVARFLKEGQNTIKQSRFDDAIDKCRAR